MTVQALLVIRAQQSRLVDVRIGFVDAVTGLARGMLLTRWRVVMTDDAAGSHLRHLSVSFVIERHGQVSVLQLVE